MTVFSICTGRWTITNQYGTKPRSIQSAKQSSKALLLHPGKRKSGEGNRLIQPLLRRWSTRAISSTFFTLRLLPRLIPNLILPGRGIPTIPHPLLDPVYNHVLECDRRISFGLQFSQAQKERGFLSRHGNVVCHASAPNQLYQSLH